MKNVKQSKKLIVVLLVFFLICWMAMMATDFILAKQAKKPIFSIYSEITDADRYRGLGYTIYIKFQGPIGMPDEELKGYFYWGWH